MEAIQELVAELSCGQDDCAEAAVPRLAAYGTAALPALRELLASPDADQRWWAVRVLAEIPDQQVPALLVGILKDPEVAVRQCAVLGLRKQPTEAAIPVLIDALRDPDGMLASLAGEALVAAGAPAVPALIEVLEHGAQPARLQAARALARIGDPRAIPSLFKCLDDDSALIEHWASEGLERMGVGMTFFKP